MRRAWRTILPSLIAALLAGGAVGWVVRGEKTRYSVSTRQSELTPPGALPLDMRVLHGTDPPQLAVAWQRNSADQYPVQFGLTIWQRRRDNTGWRSIYARKIDVKDEATISDLRLQTADLTNDGRDDLYVVEDLDGSGGHFVYRVLTTQPGQVRQIEARRTSADQTTVIVQPGALISYDGVGRDPSSGTYIHCCPRYWRRTVKRWNGKRLVAVSTSRAKRRPSSRY